MVNLYVTLESSWIFKLFVTYNKTMSALPKRRENTLQMENLNRITHIQKGVEDFEGELQTGVGYFEHDENSGEGRG